MCHSLAFDQIGGTIRTLRHGAPAQVIADLRALYRAGGPQRPAELERRRPPPARRRRRRSRGRDPVRPRPRRARAAPTRRSAAVFSPRRRLLRLPSRRCTAAGHARLPHRAGRLPDPLYAATAGSTIAPICTAGPAAARKLRELPRRRPLESRHGPAASPASQPAGPAMAASTRQSRSRRPARCVTIITRPGARRPCCSGSRCGGTGGAIVPARSARRPSRRGTRA